MPSSIRRRSEARVKMRIHRVIRSLLTFAVIGIAAQSGLSQSTAAIRTEQTYLELGGGETGPHIVTLGSGANSWRNEGPETLLDSVVLEGHTVPVRWKFNANASR